MLGTLVFKGYHDETDCFRNGQDKRKDPDGDNLNGSDQGNPNSLNTTPGGNCSVPEKKKAGEGGDGTKLLGNLKLFQLKIYKYWKVSPLGKWPTTGFLGTFCESWCEKWVGPWRFPRIWKSIVWQVWVWVLHLEPSKTFWVWSVAASDRCACVFSPGGKTGWWKG